MKKILFVFLFIIFIASLSHAKNEIYVSSPDFVSPMPFKVAIKINASPPPQGAQCDVVFNASVLQAVNVSNGGMFEQLVKGGNFSKIDNVNGSIKNIVAFSFNSTSNGTFVVITFMAIKGGISCINLTNVILADANATVIDTDIKNASICVDVTPPTTTKEIGTPKYDNGSFVNFSTPIWLNATDNANGSGVNATYYRIWNGTWHPIDTNDYYCGNHNITYNGTYWYVYRSYNASHPVNFGPIHFCEECMHVIEYYSIDNASNAENITTQIHYVDNSPPNTNIELNGIMGNNGWYVSNVNVTLNATDNGSGINKIYYKIDNITHQFNNSFNLTEDGIYNISYYAVDNLGNIEQEKIKTVKIDKTMPSSEVNQISQYFVISAIASDSLSGINHVELYYKYSSNNSTWNNWLLYGSDNEEPYQWQFNAPYGKGYYKFYSIAYDNAGNEENIPSKADALFYVNHPPYAANPSPSNGSSGIEINTTLSVVVYDADNDTMNVVFYNASDNTIIGIDENVASGDTAAITWGNLAYNTTYYWYVVVNDGIAENKSETWHFKTKQKENSPPRCSLQANPINGNAPLTVTFFMSASDSDGSIASWQLDLNNDGLADYNGNGRPPASLQYVYSNAGSYTAKLTVVDDRGAKAYDIITIIVSNNLFNNLIASFSYSPIHPYAGDEIQFFDKSIGNIVSYTWQFGDGNVSHEKNPKHRYSKAGNYTVILQVSDGSKQEIEEKNLYVAPEIFLSINFYPHRPSPGMNVSFFGFSNGNILNWTWQFGDGSIGYGKNVTHVYNSVDRYNVTLVALYGGGKKIVRKEIDVMLAELSIKKIDKFVRGKNAVIEAVIENDGGSISNVEVCFYKNGKIFYDDALDIGYGEEKKIERQANLSKGKNEIKVFIDPEKKIEEENKENNVASVYIYYKNASFPWYLIPIILAIFVFLYIWKKRKKIPIKEEQGAERCAVCFGRFKENSPIVRCKCGAVFHKSCAERVKICPNCGRKLKI